LTCTLMTVACLYDVSRFAWIVTPNALETIWLQTEQHDKMKSRFRPNVNAEGG